MAGVVVHLRRCTKGWWPVSNGRFCIIPARALGDKRLNRTDIMVLNALGLFGNKEGWSFPSTSTIADMIGAHRVSVSKALSSLAACGYVETRTRYRTDGGQTSNEYRILFDAPSVQGSLDLGMPSAPDYDGEPPVADSLPPCSETATPPVAAGTTPPVTEPLHHIKEPTLTPHSNTALLSAGDASADAKGILPEFAEVYQRVLEILNSPTPYSGGPVHQWLAGGAIPEVDIYPTIKRIAAGREKPPTTLKYFTQAIADAVADRLKPMPEGNPYAKPSAAHQQHHRPSKTERLIAAAKRANGGSFGFDAVPQSPNGIDGDAHAVLSSIETVR
jgi:hypothetical protein